MNRIKINFILGALFVSLLTPSANAADFEERTGQILQFDGSAFKNGEVRCGNEKAAFDSTGSFKIICPKGSNLEFGLSNTTNLDRSKPDSCLENSLDTKYVNSISFSESADPRHNLLPAPAPIFVRLPKPVTVNFEVVDASNNPIPTFNLDAYDFYHFVGLDGDIKYPFTGRFPLGGQKPWRCQINQDSPRSFSVYPGSSGFRQGVTIYVTTSVGGKRTQKTLSGVELSTITNLKFCVPINFGATLDLPDDCTEKVLAKAEAEKAKPTPTPTPTRSATPAQNRTAVWVSNTLTNLNPSGSQISGSFSSFPTKAGLYLFQCVKAKSPDIRPEDCLDLGWVTSSGGRGALSAKDQITLSVKAQFKTSNKSVDCLIEECGLFFRYDRSAPDDKSEDFFSPMSFKQVSPTPTPTPSATPTPTPTPTPSATPKSSSAGRKKTNWLHGCPEEIDETPQLPSPKTMVLTSPSGQTFKLLAKDSVEYVQQPESVLGCYVVEENVVNSELYPAWQIGAVRRDVKGFYFINQANITWRLTLNTQNSVLETEPGSHYYRKGAGFVLGTPIVAPTPTPTPKPSAAKAFPTKSKEKTLTCVKGKSSLKVIGKTPKCPSGYKVKK
jgi:hypothetical protein